MAKVVINKCYGGFGLSKIALERYNELAGTSHTYGRDIGRTDANLIQIVEELGVEVNDSNSKLKIVEVPDDVDWELKQNDGMEWIAETHETWS